MLLFHQPFTLARLLFLPFACLIAYNLYGNYYLVTKVDPGNPLSAWETRDPSALRLVEDARNGVGRGIKACGKCGGPKPVVRLSPDLSLSFSTLGLTTRRA